MGHTVNQEVNFIFYLSTFNEKVKKQYFVTSTFDRQGGGLDPGAGGTSTEGVGRPECCPLSLNRRTKISASAKSGMYAYSHWA